MKFCPECGARIKQVPRGGRPNFCTSCGTEFSQDAAPKEQSLVDNFPFETMRPSQKEVLEQVEAALAARKKFIILEAPVGFGKSAIAASLCRHLGSAYLLTSTKQLQDQYSADFGFPVVMGKSNFTCLVPTNLGKHLACSKGRCEADWTLSDCPHYLAFEEYDDHKRRRCSRQSKCEHLKEGKLCPYYEQKWDAFRSPITVANYPFLMTELRYTDDIRPRKLLVCDEAHDLEKQMVSSAGFAMRRSTVESYATSAGGLPVIPDKGVDDASAWTEPLLTVKRTLERFVEDNLKDASEQDRVASCKDSLDSLTGFVEDLKAHPANWVVNSVRKTAILGDGDAGSSVDEVVFQPLEVRAFTAALFGAAETVLLMSATVFSKEAFCRTLGIPEEDASFIRVKGSSFPVENRRIHALNTAQLSRATMDASLEAVANAVDSIMTRHAGERGVVHTTSYQQVRYIVEHVSEANRARLSSTEGIASRSGLLRTHGSTDQSVLISPSLYQGVDLKDDLSRFQILVKVPFPDLSDRRTKVKLERDPHWYDWQTALRIVQTYGRSIRSADDHATTYLLDTNFIRFLNNHRELFPDYFLEAIVAEASRGS